jgi:uncharacterized protein YaaQ
MKLLIAIVGRDDASPALEAFARERLAATLIDARGGLLSEGSAAILAGLDDHALPRAFRLLREHCRRRRGLLPTDMPEAMHEWAVAEVVPVEVGGAVVFVLPVARFERL